MARYLVAGWYTCYFVLSMVLKGGGILANDPAKWLWFVILPVFLLWIVRRKQNANFISLLRSVGLHRQGLGRALLIGLVVYAILLPCSLFSMPDSQIDKLMTILQEPLKAALVFPLCLVFALVLPGFTEEIFFRGILQSRLAEFMNSDIRSLLITSFLFGIYHLPYAFFYDSWPTFGNWGWSITSVITEQMVAGLILGVLWMRTRNLFACVLVHGLIDVLPMAANLNITIG